MIMVTRVEIRPRTQPGGLKLPPLARSMLRKKLTDFVHTTPSK